MNILVPQWVPVLGSSLSLAPSMTRGLHWFSCHSACGGFLEQAFLWGPSPGSLVHSFLGAAHSPTLNHLAQTVFSEIQQACEINRAQLGAPTSQEEEPRVHLGKPRFPEGFLWRKAFQESDSHAIKQRPLGFPYSPLSPVGHGISPIQTPSNASRELGWVLCDFCLPTWPWNKAQSLF